MRILLVEDESRMGQALTTLLQEEHYEVDYAADGSLGEELALSRDYDLFILDVMLPGKNGFEIAKSLRMHGSARPILFLTARSSIDDKEEGFESGADDYLTKPFETRELLMRVKALLRRRSSDIYRENEDASQSNGIKFGNLILEESGSLIRNADDGREVNLFGKELRLLTYLLENRTRILSKEQITNYIWGYDNEAEYNNAEVYVSFLRKKLRFIDANVEIKTFRGLGYQIREI